MADFPARALEHSVAWCNGATRVIERLRTIAQDVRAAAGDESVEYDDVLIAVVLLKKRRDEYRERIAEMSAPWFEVARQ
jgi:hypothetical protein